MENKVTTIRRTSLGRWGFHVRKQGAVNQSRWRKRLLEKTEHMSVCGPGYDRLSAGANADPATPARGCFIWGDENSSMVQMQGQKRVALRLGALMAQGRRHRAGEREGRG